MRDEVPDPGRVPEEDEWWDVGAGFDTDADGRPDTLVAGDGIDLVVAIDFDGDRMADQVLRIGPDAVVREVGSAAGAETLPGPADELLPDS